jgi:hypothetical protein
MSIRSVYGALATLSLAMVPAPVASQPAAESVTLAATALAATLEHVRAPEGTLAIDTLRSADRVLAQLLGEHLGARTTNLADLRTCRDPDAGFPRCTLAGSGVQVIAAIQQLQIHDGSAVVLLDVRWHHVDARSGEAWIPGRTVQVSLEQDRAAWQISDIRTLFQFR